MLKLVCIIGNKMPINLKKLLFIQIFVVTYAVSKSMSFANEFYSFVLKAHRDLVGQSSVSYNRLLGEYLLDTKIPES